MADETRQQAESKEDFGQGQTAKVSRWVAEINAYEKAFKTWHTRAPKILKRYRDEKEDQEAASEGRQASRRFNILWSNVQTLQPSLYSKTPSPEVSRRWKDRDPVARAAAEILERALVFCVDSYDFDGPMKQVRDDYLLPGRGQAWVRFKPTHGPETQDRIDLIQAGTEEVPIYQDASGEAFSGEVLTDDAGLYGMSEPYEPVVYEELTTDYVNWRDFGHSSAATWEKVTAVWKREKMTRAQLVKRFGKEIGNAVPLNYRDNNIEDKAADQHEVFRKALVYEIWDKESRKVIWICRDYAKAPLDEQDDILGLDGFFPCPKPLYATTTTDSLVPVPDYAQYQSQAEELDDLTERIDLLTSALRVAGVYNGEYQELERLIASRAENVLIPVHDWAMFAEKGGIDGGVSWLPIEQIAKVLAGLFDARERVKQDLYEITGISDIIRGQVDPREKLGQSQLKGQFASLRLRERQDEVARFVRDVMRIKAEIIAEKFSPETLLTMTGWDMTVAAQQAQEVEGEEIPPAELFQQAVALLKDDRLRSFRIDIETDSTVLEDRQAEQAARTEFLATVTPFLQQAIIAIEQYPELKPLVSEMMLFCVRGFRAGRHLESVFEEAIDTMRNAPPQNQPDPALMLQAETEKQKVQFEHEREMQRIQFEHEVNMAKAQAEQMTAQRPDQVVQFSQAQEQQIGQALTQMAAQQAESLSGALQAIAQMQQAQQQTMQMVAQAIHAIGGPRTTELIRDASGRPVGARSTPANMRLQ